VRRLVVVVVACSAPAATPATVPTRQVVMTDARTPDAGIAVESIPPSPGHDDVPLHDRQQQLGAGATTCFGTAKILAAQGYATDEHLRWREQAILQACTRDKWPERVRECVATADHDPLSCTAYLTDAQKQRWNPIFDAW
jgi:hypothetical protein